MSDSRDFGGYYNHISQNGLYDAHGTVDCGGHTALSLGNCDFTGWYKTKAVADDSDPSGSKRLATVQRLGQDIDIIVSETERTLYTTTTYVDPDSLRWEQFRYAGSGREWVDKKPTPGYPDIRGQSILADIDLADEYKQRPLKPGTREIVEKAIDEYAAAFGELVGNAEHVFGLDSVGGIYLLTPPAATAPIPATFDPVASGRILDELCQRANRWLETTKETVNDRVTGARGVFEADLLNNKNRLYKAPLSVHGEIDGVVHPIKPDTARYDFVGVDDVDDRIIKKTRKWSEEFTDESHATGVESVVSTLWPDYIDEHDGWQAALEAWIVDEESAEAERKRKEEKAREERIARAESRDAELPRFTDVANGNKAFGIATNFDDVRAAVDAIDAREVVRDLCEEFDTDPGRDPIRFEPGYRDSGSGTSCFVTPEKIVDLNDSHKAIGALDYIAREEGYIDPTETATGESRAKARESLRELGYPIPVFTPVKGSKSHDGEVFDEMPSWARAKAAVTLGLCEESDVEDSWRLPPEIHDALLDILEDRGIEHGCERLTSPADIDLTTNSPKNPSSGFDEMMANARSELEISKESRTPPIHRSRGIQYAADALCSELDFVFPREETRGWREVLYVYADGEYVGSTGESGVYEPSGKRTVNQLTESELVAFADTSTLRQIEKKCERRADTRARWLDANPERLVVNNGILDLHTGELDPHTPEEYHRTRIETEYDLNADCPAIDEFIHDIVDEEDVETVYRAIAHTLYKDYPAEKAIMLLGDGANGKTVLLTLIERFLGEWNVAGESLQDLADSDKQFSERNLLGRLANIDPDMGNQTVENMATVKALTGRDTVSANVKFERPVAFQNHATLLFAANEIPVIEDDTYGNWRRWVMIDFPNTFRPEDEDYVPKQQLLDRLTTDEELEGLLARCVEEIRECQETDREWFPNVDAPETVRRRMRKAAEPVFAFADDCLVADDDAVIPKEDVRALYDAYATEHSLPKIDKSQFSKQLLALEDYTVKTPRGGDGGDRIQLFAGISRTAYARKLEDGGREGEDKGEGEEPVDTNDREEHASAPKYTINPSHDGIPSDQDSPEANAARLRFIQRQIDDSSNISQLPVIASEQYDEIPLEDFEAAIETLESEDE